MVISHTTRALEAILVAHQRSMSRRPQGTPLLDAFKAAEE